MIIQYCLGIFGVYIRPSNKHKHNYPVSAHCLIKISRLIKIINHNVCFPLFPVSQIFNEYISSVKNSHGTPVNVSIILLFSSAKDVSWNRKLSEMEIALSLRTISNKLGPFVLFVLGGGDLLGQNDPEKAPFCSK